MVGKKSEGSVVWKKLHNDNESTAKQSIPDTNCHPAVPLILLTVDTPIYRARHEETIHHLNQWQRNCQCIQEETHECHSIATSSCDLLNLEEHPALGVKKILFEGWRTVFLPQTMQKHFDSEPPIHFVLAAEDDIRFPDHITPCELVRICEDAFQSNPSIDILSLGHSWKAIQKTNKRTPKDEMNISLLHFLQEAKGAGVHGSTLLAIRLPEGITRLLEAMDRATDNRKQTHLDQFLFYSLYHDLKIAMCDPPLVGWAEVALTLTKSSSGHRRKGGGRFGFLPKASQSNSEGLIWIQRVLVEEGS